MIACSTRLNCYRRRDRNYNPAVGNEVGWRAGIGSAGRAGHPRYCCDMSQRIFTLVVGIGNLSLLRRDIPAETAARQSYTVNHAACVGIAGTNEAISSR